MKVTAEIPDLTPSQLAECFWELDDNQQADFFATLGACALAAKCWGVTGSYFPLEMQMLSASEKASPHARRVMEIMGYVGTKAVIQPLCPKLDEQMITSRTKGTR